VLQPGNGKLGKIHTFSVPAGSCCPGQTTVCAKQCYAKAGRFRLENVKRHHIENLALARQPDFVTRMCQEIVAKHVTRVRIHTAGDFFDWQYVEDWMRIAEMSPGVVFYAYTRSWRESEILPMLIELSRLPNVKLWWSVDSETHAVNGPPPAVPGVRVAYMAVTDDEPVPDYANLVFRVRRRTVQKRSNGVLVCPAENGVKTTKKVHCITCRLCWGDFALPRKQQKGSSNDLSVCEPAMC
jgi:hypothetical protein